MNQYYKVYQLDKKFLKCIKQNIDNIKLIETRFLKVIEPSYCIQGFQYVKKEFTTFKNIEHSHILIIGLSDHKLYDSSRVILKLPLNNSDVNNDYNTLFTTTNTKLILDIFKKYNMSCYNTSKILERQKEVIESIKSEYMPMFIRDINGCKSVLFESIDFNFANDYISPNENEYLVVYLNRVDENKSNRIINVSNSFNMSSGFIPFQVIRFVGTYNDKSFEYLYTTYWFFDRDVRCSKIQTINNNKISQLLGSIYEEIKKRNNSKYRESHLDSKILDYKSEIRNELLDSIDNIDEDIYIDYPYLDEAEQSIGNYVANTELEFGDYVVQHVQTVVNTWEENGHGMVSFRDEIYEETTELKCNVYILYGSYKITVY
jgi:hypothetical protein